MKVLLKILRPQSLETPHILGTVLPERSIYICDFRDSSVVKNPPANAGDTGLISGLGRYPGEGHGNSLQYSCLEKPTDRGASVQFSSVAQLCLTLCDPMNRSTPGPLSITNSQSPPKPMSIDAIQPSHSLSSPSPPVLNLSQHQGLFK